MPRSNRPRRGRSRRGSGAPQGRSLQGLQGLAAPEVDYAGRRWAVRQVRGDLTAVHRYRCPGCDHEVGAAVAHTVVWPVDGMGGLDNRRHWHTPCWQARDRRRPRGSFA